MTPNLLSPSDREKVTLDVVKLIDALRRAQSLSVLGLAQVAGVDSSNLARYLKGQPRSYFSERQVGSCLNVLGWSTQGLLRTKVHRWSFPAIDDDVQFLFRHAFAGEARVAYVYEDHGGSRQAQVGLLVVEVSGAHLILNERVSKKRGSTIVTTGLPELSLLAEPIPGMTTPWMESLVLPASEYEELKSGVISPARFDELVLNRKPTRRFDLELPAAEALQTAFAEGMTQSELTDWVENIRTLRACANFASLVRVKVDQAQAEHHDRGHYEDRVFDEPLQQEIAEVEVAGVAGRPLTTLMSTGLAAWEARKESNRKQLG